MKYVKITSFKENQFNPFLTENDGSIMSIQTGKRKIILGPASEIIVDRESGECKGHAVFMQEKKVDKEVFVKLYLSELQAFFSLSKISINLLFYIMQVLKPNKDVVFFDIEDAMKYTKYSSKTTIMKGLSELLKNQFIARTRKSYMYFINPRIFFNGDRISFIKSYALKNDNELKELK